MANLNAAPEILSLAKSQEMFTALETKKSAIGIVDAVAFNDAAGKFKAIKIDGKSFDSANWSFVLRNHLVVGKSPKDSVKKFLEFVASPEGQAIIKSNKAKPVKFSL